MSLIFPRWTNTLPPLILGGLTTVALGAIGGVWYYFTPKFWSVGYRPEQPVNYSHQIHVGKLGMDCRYCHTHVEESNVANIPDTATCLGCHTGAGEAGYLNADLWKAHKDNVNLVRVREAGATHQPVLWRRVHKLPDYVQFTHAAHVNAGISCVSCHARIDEQAVVRQSEPLTMGWCLDCHRAPEGSLVDSHGVLGTKVRITDLNLVSQLLASPDQMKKGAELASKREIQPPQHCGACHY
ncbi:MAG TPA: cytochrome c3 family protein [Phycisphaerales bacterium]|nr:cytochrome c3 family protein [Phycisphaerales bacterium]